MMNFSHPHFEAPRWLWLAVVAPLLFAWLQRRAAVKRKSQLAQIASPRFVEELTASHSAARRRFKNFLLLLAFAFAGIALARPQWGELKSSGQFLGEDVVFVVDCSYSMLSTDVRPNRLQRAKLAVSDFVRAHGRGRVGLVAFAGSAFLQCPLTLDYDAFQDSLNALDEKTIPVPGTDIGRALQEANHAMEKNSRRKLVVLLSDGEDLENGGVATAKTLATNGVVIFTVGIGTPAGSEIQMLNPAGQLELVRDAKGELVRSRLDEKTLTAIASATGGNYFPLGQLGEGLAKVRSAVETLDRLAELKRTRSLGIERFYWPVAAMLVLLVAEPLVGTRQKKFCEKRIKKNQKLFKATLIILAGIFISGTAFGAANETTNADNSISPPVAGENPRELYNAGTEKLRAGKLGDAETLLESSVAKQDERLQPAALFNLGHVRFAQGIEELKKSPDGETTAKRTQIAADDGANAISKVTDALATNDVQQMVDAYLAGRGARKEMRSALAAVRSAMEAHGNTLLKWRRALGDFRSAAELNPADTNATHNAEAVEQAIARLVDSMRAMQQAAGNLAGKQSELNGLLKKLKGLIPAPNAPPGATGDDDDDDDGGKLPSPESLSGLQESKGSGGQELDLKISPEAAGQLLNSIQPDGKQLPMGQGDLGKPINRSGRIW